MILAVRKLFEHIAMELPEIGHDPENGRIAFFGYDFDESNSGDRSDLSFPRLGMATKTRNANNGNYSLQGGSVSKRVFFNVLLLDIIRDEDNGDYTLCRARMDVLADTIVAFLNQVATSDARFKFCDSIPFTQGTEIGRTEVGPMTQQNAHGILLSFDKRHDFVYDTDNNPLDNLLQNGIPENP